MDEFEVIVKNKELEMSECNAMLEAATTFAKIVLQNVIIVNGMSIVSLLTFLGNVIVDKNLDYNRTFIFWGAIAFSLGVFLGLVATILAYLAQQDLRDVYTDPEKENVLNERGIREREIALFCVIISAVCFIGGAFVCLNGII